MNDIAHAARVQTHHLACWTQQELASLFGTLAAGNPPLGCLRGELFAFKGLGVLPRPLAQALYRALGTRLNPWRGKSFADGHGSNQWGGLPGAEFGRYVLRLGPGADGDPSLLLDYDVAENPRLLRAILGEARHLQEGLWLCRMLWRAPRGAITLLWFTLKETGDGR